MSRIHVDHRDLVRFAEERVNLPKDKADEYRAQVRRLREKLESYLQEHPDFSLRRMLLAGSLAKGTALRSLNDIDVAAYISGSDAPGDVAALLEYLATRLRTAFPNFKPEQVQPKTYCVTVSFRGSGLDVDVVPILYAGSADWRGNLISQDDGTFLETSIPLHLEFTKRRKQKVQTHFAQVVRLVKFWAHRQKAENEQFRFKSFLIELSGGKAPVERERAINHVALARGEEFRLANRQRGDLVEPLVMREERRANGAVFPSAQLFAEERGMRRRERPCLRVETKLLQFPRCNRAPS